MIDKIKEGFDKEFGAMDFGTQAMRSAFREVYAKGYLQGKVDSIVQEEQHEGTWTALVECDDWGCKPDGYLVAFTKEALLERQEGYEHGNTHDYGLYYERPNIFQTAVLTPEAVAAIVGSETGCAYFKRRSDFEAIL